MLLLLLVCVASCPQLILWSFSCFAASLVFAPCCPSVPTSTWPLVCPDPNPSFPLHVSDKLVLIFHLLPISPFTPCLLISSIGVILTGDAWDMYPALFPIDGFVPTKRKAWRTPHAERHGSPQPAHAVKRSFWRVVYFLFIFCVRGIRVNSGRCELGGNSLPEPIEQPLVPPTQFPHGLPEQAIRNHSDPLPMQSCFLFEQMLLSIYLKTPICSKYFLQCFKVKKKKLKVNVIDLTDEGGWYVIFWVVWDSQIISLHCVGRACQKPPQLCAECRISSLSQHPASLGASRT